MVNLKFINHPSSFDLSDYSHSAELIKRLSECDVDSIPFLNDWHNDANDITVKTSGSTGAPKSISLSKTSMAKSAELTLQYFKLEEGDIILQCLPTGFIAGKMIWVRALVGKLNILVAKPSSNPIKDLNNVVTFAAMTPHQVSTVLEENPEKLQLIKTLIIGGGVVTDELHGKLQKLTTVCYATYGMTETITHVAVKQLNGDRASDFYEGLQGVEFRINEAQTLEILATHISADWIRTNDVVEMQGANHFRWLGRTDFVINSGGVKLFPETLESKIQAFISCPYYIHKKTDAKFGELPVLVLEGNTEVELAAFSEVLNAIEMPKEIIRFEKFAYTENGKIDRIKTFSQVL